jgi:hypothetical protein
MWRKMTKMKAPPILLSLMAVGVAAYGVYAAIERQFFLKMFWRIDFAFYDSMSTT